MGCGVTAPFEKLPLWRLPQKLPNSESSPSPKYKRAYGRPTPFGSPHGSISAQGCNVKQMHTDDNLDDTPPTLRSATAQLLVGLERRPFHHLPSRPAAGCLPLKSLNLWLTALDAGCPHGPGLDNTRHAIARRRGHGATAASCRRADVFTGKLDSYPSPHLPPHDATAESV